MALHNAQSNFTFSSITLQPEKWGRIVESAIGAHLLNSSLTDGFRLHYWRHRNDEIDFVMEKRGQLVGLEIKSGSHQKSSGMKAFQSQLKPGKVILVGDSGLPWQEFLQLNPAQLF